MSFPNPVSISISSAPSRMMGDGERWFKEEVQPHEPALRSFLRSRFPGVPDLDDVIQEAYLRLFRAKGKGAITNVKSFLFSTARNVAVDGCRRRTSSRTDSIADIELLSVQDKRRSGAEAVCYDQELEFLREAIAALPRCCRLIISLRKIEGLSRKEIAQKLGIAENTVNAQIQLGMMRVHRYFSELGFTQGGRE